MVELRIEEAKSVLAENAMMADDKPEWPLKSWEALRRSGVLGWCIPPIYGGSGLDGEALLGGYEELASACLTTCFILSQREAACRRIRDSSNVSVARELLAALARGEIFATVGLSHLTTSRQHVAPSFTAIEKGDSLILNGTIPWITGAAKADYIVLGAVLEDSRQILAALPRHLPGVEIGPPLDLMALKGSLTAEMHCKDVALNRKWLLAGPTEKVIAIGKGGTGGFETSCLALGLARSAIDYLAKESQARPDLRTTADRLGHNFKSIRESMLSQLTGNCATDGTAALRARANSLVLRATQSALTAAKGAGFLRNHPTQRWARQALFFLVWSCPRPAAEATLAYLAGPEVDCA